MTRELPIRTALLDDHAVVRMGYELVFSQDGRFDIVGAYSKSGELFAALRMGLTVDVLLLDYALADADVDGAQLITTLRRQYPELRILVASAHDNPATASLALRAGAHGFLGKAQPLTDLAAAIARVAQGRRYVSDELSSRLPPLSSLRAARDRIAAQEKATGQPVPAEALLIGALSKREQEVMRCVLDGMAVSEVAAKFSRSTKTISNQKQSAFRKLGVRSLVELSALRDRLLGNQE